MSTAIERVMRERGDCFCMHEPFMYYYYVELASKGIPLFETEPDRPSRFKDIVALVMGKAREGPVFCKDLACYVLAEITRYKRHSARWRHRRPSYAIILTIICPFTKYC